MIFTVTSIVTKFFHLNIVFVWNCFNKISETVLNALIQVWGKSYALEFLSDLNVKNGNIFHPSTIKNIS